MSDILRKKAGSSSSAQAKAGEQAGTSAPRTSVEITIDGERVIVTPDLEVAVLRAHKGLLQPLPNEMTTTQAAAYLDVSRPFLVKLIRQGSLPYRMVGKHHRVPTEALRKYKETMYQRASNAAREISEL